MVEDVACYVDETGRGHFYCPRCGMVQYISVAERKLTRNRFSDTCACGGEMVVRVYLSILDFNPLQISGSYQVRNRPGRGQILIKELHLTAIDFVCTDALRLFPGDRLDLTFHLQNAEKTPVTLQVMITDVRGMRAKAVHGDADFSAPAPA